MGGNLGSWDVRVFTEQKERIYPKFFLESQETLTRATNRKGHLEGLGLKGDGSKNWAFGY